MCSSHGLFRRALSLFNVTDFFGGLYDALLVERVRFGMNLIAELLQSRGMAVWKIGRHEHLLDLCLAQDHMHNVHAPGCRDAMISRTALDLRVGQYTINGGLALRPIHLKIIHNKQALTLDFQVDEWIRRNEFGGVIEV